MKYPTWITLLFGLSVIQPVYSQHKTPFVGEIHGIKLDSFRRNEVVPFEQFNFPPISASRHRIEIRLYSTGFPMSNVVCIIFTYDTAFHRTGYSVPLYPDSLDKVKQIPAMQNNLDSIFGEMVRSGIFSIESTYHDDITKNYRPMYITSSGLDTTQRIRVSDGTYYFLEYKVDKFYDQKTFDNPEAYGDYYRDNQILRRQKEIVSAITTGIKY